MASSYSKATPLTSAPPGAATRDREPFNVALHGLRGVASLMVLWAHILGGTAEHVYSSLPGYVAFVVAPWNLGTYGVQLFFVISGFVILPSVLRYTPGEFAVRRFLRLYPLFLALTAAFVVLNAVTHDYPKLNDAGTVVAGLLFINLFTGTEQLTPNAWSLSFEVCFYVLACFVVEAAVRRRNEALTAVAVMVAVAFAAWFPITIYFALGIGIRLLHDRGHVLQEPTARRLEALTIPILIYTASRGHYKYDWADIGSATALATIAVTGCYVYLAAHRRSLTAAVLGNRALLYVGTISYSLYLVHPYVYLVLRKLFAGFGWFGPDPLLPMLVFGIVTTSAALVASHFAHIALERWPYQRFFHQGIYRVGTQTRATS